MSQTTIFMLISALVILLWAINTFISRESKIRKVLNVVVVIAVIISLFKVL
jgi:hypothetical protein